MRKSGGSAPGGGNGIPFGSGGIGGPDAPEGFGGNGGNGIPRPRGATAETKIRLGTILRGEAKGKQLTGNKPGWKTVTRTARNGERRWGHASYDEGRISKVDETGTSIIERFRKGINLPMSGTAHQ